MTKFEVSYAYPSMSLFFVLAFLLAVGLFDKAFTTQKIIGLGLIVLGVVAGRSA